MIGLFLIAGIVGCNHKDNMIEQKGRAEPVAPSQSYGVCSPTFLPLTEEAVKVRIDPYLEIGASVILIGCETELQKIERNDRDKLESYFESVIEEHHYLLERKRLQMNFRNDLVADVNSLIGGGRVADVFIYGIYSTEFGPAQ